MSSLTWRWRREWRTVLLHFLWLRTNDSKYSPARYFTMITTGISQWQPDSRLPATNLHPPFFSIQLQWSRDPVRTVRNLLLTHLWGFFFFSDWIITTSVGGFCCWVSIVHSCWPCWRGDKQTRLRQERSPLPKDLSFKVFFIFASAEDPPVLSTHKHINILYGCSSYFCFFLPLQLRE